MTLSLPDPPESLKPAPRSFYDELRRMLDRVQPAQVDPRRSSVKFDKSGVEVELVHLDRKDWMIWATVGDRDAIVGALGAHEHFFGPSDGEHEDRPWTTQIVDFVAEILRGEIEVETTYRGRAPISVRHFSLDARGKRHSLGYTGFLTPARLFFGSPSEPRPRRRRGYKFTRRGSFGVYPKTGPGERASSWLRAHVAFESDRDTRKGAALDSAARGSGHAPVDAFPEPSTGEC